jgi:hypothetical protein
MNATVQLRELSDKIADAIVDLVNDTDGPVTLSQVDREVPGFTSEEPSIWQYLIEHSGNELLIWSGMSEAGYAALCKVISGRRVAIQFVDVRPYMLDMLDGFHINDVNWLPSVLVPAKAANLEAPRRLIRTSKGSRKHIMAWAAAKKKGGYRRLTPSPMRFTADQFSL